VSTPQESHANPHISVVVAAYNEEDTIGAVLDALGELDLDMEVIVVNDGSTDRTAAIIESRTGPRLQLISKPNGGKGTALRAGFEAASGSIIVIQDADVELSPARIPDLIAPILADDADVVFGSRFLEPVPGLGWERRLANWFLTMLSNISFHTNLTDMETCYKMFRTEMIQGLTLKERRFGFEPEVTAKIARVEGARIYEVGISYYGRTFAEGKKIGWKDGFRAIYCIVKYGLFK
jgi:glycosyltransferase involved in cell wall biosynthesis